MILLFSNFKRTAKVFYMIEMQNFFLPEVFNKA